MIANIYIDRVEKAISNAKERKLSGITTPVYETVSFLNELVSYPDVHHLHIGLNAGVSFVGAMYGNKPLSVFGIDNYCQKNENRYDEFIENCANNNVTDFVMFYEDCFNLKPESKSQIKDINVYFYDAEHEEIDNYNAFMYYLDNLADVSIVVVDDIHYAPVLPGINRAISENKFIVHKQWELREPKDGTWYNNLLVLVIEKKNNEI